MSHGTRARPEAVTSGRAMLPRDRMPAHRSSAGRRVCRSVSRCIVRLRRYVIQTVGDDPCRSISIDRAHDAERRRGGGRLK
uniref:Uncharacterized protein n=1 Tax=Burkholderia cenocepacia TaxID=95486 RepID=A0A071M7D3_9BURK